MFDSHQEYTGTQYTPTVALLVVAFVFCPAVLMLSRPFGSVLLITVLGCTVLCATLAWFSWKKLSRRTLASIVVRESR